MILRDCGGGASNGPHICLHHNPPKPGNMLLNTSKGLGKWDEHGNGVIIQVGPNQKCKPWKEENFLWLEAEDMWQNRRSKHEKELICLC